MPGGLASLVAAGCQDVYLIGTPGITYFKVIYRMHINYTFEPTELDNDKENKYIEPIDDINYDYSNDIIDKNDLFNIDHLFNIDKYIENINLNNTIYI
jgi:hypothetical protein